MGKDSYRLKLFIPHLPEMNTAFTRRHWTVRNRNAKRWRDLVWGTMKGQGLPFPKEPLRRAWVRYTRLSSHEPDYINLVAGMKEPEDALVHNKILVDDAPAIYCGGRPEVEWTKATRKGAGILIEVEERTDDRR